MVPRRSRRTGAAPATVLPLRSGDPPNPVSCWYCDYKISGLNRVLFSFGRKRARFLGIWFAIGVAFSYVSIVGVTMILLWEVLGAFHLHSSNLGPDNLLSWLFGISPLVRSFGLSIVDACMLVLSTLMSLVIHEFGHAIAAASEGIQSEYIAIFLAMIFPGALVAFNNDLLQNLPGFAALRIYCAGIWHNIMVLGLCKKPRKRVNNRTVCGLALFLLPSLLSPLHVYGKGPMVLKVPETSPLSGYLARGDVIESVDGATINVPHEWMEKMNQIHTKTLTDGVSSVKGYCVPNTWVEIGKNIQSADDRFSCPNELASFARISCSSSNLFAGNNNADSGKSESEAKSCLTAKDVVKLKKCGEGWQMNRTHRINCTCVEDESCMAPLIPAGMSWVEVSYSSPFSSECLLLREKLIPADSESLDSGSTACGGTFVFIGDAISMASSVQLSPYRPRWPTFMFSASIPTMLEKILKCNFYVSTTFALLNSLPVYFLDGASITEITLQYMTWLSPRQQRKILRLCLISGTIISFVGFLKTLYATLQSP